MYFDKRCVSDAFVERRKNVPINGAREREETPIPPHAHTVHTNGEKREEGRKGRWKGENPSKMQNKIHQNSKTKSIKCKQNPKTIFIFSHSLLPLPLSPNRSHFERLFSSPLLLSSSSHFVRTAS